MHTTPIKLRLYLEFLMILNASRLLTNNTCYLVCDRNKGKFRKHNFNITVDTNGPPRSVHGAPGRGGG